MGPAQLLIAQFQAYAQQAVHRHLVVGHHLLETLTGRLAKIDRGLLQIGTRAPFVAIGRGSDDAQSSIAAYVHPRTRFDRARNVERPAVGALQNGSSGDRKSVEEGKSGAESV